MPKNAKTRSLRSLSAAALAHDSWANTEDRTARTAPARSSFMGRFERKVREEFPDLPDDEVVRRAEHAKKAYFLRLSLASAKARRERKAG